MAQALTRKLDYFWRLFGTTVSFLVFGIGGLILWCLIFPIAVLLPGAHQQKIARSQRILHYSFIAFIALMDRIDIMTYKVNGLDKLNRPRLLIVANHPTLVDIVFLISRIKEANCIVKDSLWRNPFMRGPILNCGFISNGDPEK